MNWPGWWFATPDAAALVLFAVYVALGFFVSSGARRRKERPDGVFSVSILTHRQRPAHSLRAGFGLAAVSLEHLGLEYLGRLLSAEALAAGWTTSFSRCRASCSSANTITRRTLEQFFRFLHQGARLRGSAAYGSIGVSTGLDSVCGSSMVGALATGDVAQLEMLRLVYSLVVEIAEAVQFHSHGSPARWAPHCRSSSAWSG